ncbi:MAG: ribonuclease III [Eubacteriales bacterium]|nr:ribonuclease III [Eubacteriales bacterium]
MNTDISSLEKIIKYKFKDINLLKKALTHPSYSGEMGLKRYESNQRLEFLGDAVLELVISEYLYKTHSETEEGELTRMRSSLVFEAALDVCARDINLGDFILLGKGENQCGGREKPSILSDTYEALIGAIFLDGGIDSAKSFIYEFLINDIDELTLLHDGKSIIQEYVQRFEGTSLRYETTDIESPDHMKKFRSELYINDKLITVGNGHSKKSAEQDAAILAIKKLQIGKN